MEMVMSWGRFGLIDLINMFSKRAYDAAMKRAIEKFRSYIIGNMVSC
jgi:hypothetical protein